MPSREITIGCVISWVQTHKDGPPTREQGIVTALKKAPLSDKLQLYATNRQGTLSIDKVEWVSGPL